MPAQKQRLVRYCKDQNENLTIDGHFSYCNYSGYVDVIVISSEKSDISGSITAGVIAAIVMTSFCFILILSLFVFYYGKLKEKLSKLKQKQYENIKDDSIDDKIRDQILKKDRIKEIDLN